MQNVILTKMGSSKTDRHLMTLSGTGDHELVYDVSIMNFKPETTSNSAVCGWESIGNYISQNLFYMYIYFHMLDRRS